MKKIYSLLTGLLIITTLSLHAQDNPEEDLIVAERPGFTNPPQTVSKKHLQIESGFYYEWDKVKGTEMKTENFLYPTTLIRYGLIKNFELRLQIDIAGLVISSPVPEKNVKLSGLNPVIIGAKIYLCKQKKIRPESAFVFSLTLPYFGKEDFRPKYPAPGLAFYFQNTINEKWNIGYNLGMQWNGNDANPVSYVTIAPGYNFSKKVAGFAEIYLYYAKGQIPDFRLDAGLSYIPIPNLQLDVSGGPGISGPLSNYFISAGVSIRLPD